MPKTATTKRDKLKAFVTKFPILKTDGTVIFCKACDVAVNVDKLFNVERHLKGTTHKKKALDCERVQQLWAEVPTDNETKLVAMICKSVLAADIPLHKLGHRKIKDMFKTISTVPVPYKSTLNIYQIYSKISNIE